MSTDTLSEPERKAIDAELGHYPDRRAACIEALKIVQAQRGWVSDEALQAVASHLEMSPEEADGVATFYNLILRRPVGRHVIFYCDSVSCWVMGCDVIGRTMQAKYGIGPGQTTEDGRFTLLPICCLGNCDHAPAIMLDGRHHGDIDPQKLVALLEGADGDG